jgi:hypothetical protein
MLAVVREDIPGKHANKITPLLLLSTLIGRALKKTNTL